MSDDQAHENAESHPAKKWHHHKPTALTKAIAAITVYSLFVFIDVHDIWPWSKIVAILVGTAVSMALLYYEAFAAEAITFLTFVIGSIAICVGGIIVYLAVPNHADVVPETEVVGTLQPGAAPDPPNKCPKGSTPDSWKILIGNNAIQLAKSTKLPVLMIGSCKVLTIEKSDKGLSIDTDLFDTNGKLIATIKNNEFHALSGARASVERDHDLSKVIIKNGEGQEILNVHYINKSTVRVRGVFGCPGHALVPVKDNEPIPRVMMNGTCINVLGGIKVGAAFFGVL